MSEFNIDGIVPETNRQCIIYLVKFLQKLMLNCEITKMGLENLAIVFSPTILRCPSTDPNVLMLNIKFEKLFIQQMLQNLV